MARAYSRCASADTCDLRHDTVLDGDVYPVAQGEPAHWARA
jgi:hypothetical protein